MPPVCCKPSQAYLGFQRQPFHCQGGPAGATPPSPPGNEVRIVVNRAMIFEYDTLLLNETVNDANTEGSNALLISFARAGPRVRAQRFRRCGRRQHNQAQDHHSHGHDQPGCSRCRPRRTSAPIDKYGRPTSPLEPNRIHWALQSPRDHQ
jgi:hypothetical protein